MNTTTNASQTWSASFASATVDAMTAYDAAVPFMFTPWGEALLDEVGVDRGDAVLDVATGPGTVARVAATRAGPSGTVTACDLSPAMLAVATAKPDLAAAAPITYVECPADKSDVDDEAFNVVVCQQGLQFFPDRHAALTEMRRALKPTGRVGVTVWCGIEHCPPFEALSIALGADVQLAYRSGPWGLGSPDELTRLFDEAGFAEVRVERRTLRSSGRGAVVGVRPAVATGDSVRARPALDRMSGCRTTAA